MQGRYACCEFDQRYYRNHGIRWKITESFLRSSDWVIERVASRLPIAGVDLGDWTPLTKRIEEVLQCRVCNTAFDFDAPTLEWQVKCAEGTSTDTDMFDFLCLFEVLEHLMNPLNFLRSCREHLKRDGRLFLSTPLGKPRFLWWEHHFHEMYLPELLDLLKAAGFSAKRMEICRIRPWGFYLKGIRPLLRFFLEKTVLIEAVPVRPS
ncbi:MAG: methyltransferase domain-containing protein [bacterium]